MHNELTLELLQLSSKLSKRLDQALNIHGISLTEYQILLTLFSAPEKTMRRVDLATDIDLTASGVTRLLAPMEKIGLVEKQANPRDARVSLIRLTDSGQSILKDARITFSQSCEYISERLTENQQATMKRFLEALL